MEAKNIFDLLNSTLWQDFKGFLRDEINKDKGTVEMPFIIRELFVWLIFNPFSYPYIGYAKVSFCCIIITFSKKKNYKYGI